MFNTKSQQIKILDGLVTTQIEEIRELRKMVDASKLAAATAQGRVGALQQTIEILKEQYSDTLDRAKRMEAALLEQLVPKNSMPTPADLSELFDETPEEEEKTRRELKAAGVIEDDGLL